MLPGVTLGGPEPEMTWETAVGKMETIISNWKAQTPIGNL